MVNKIKVFYTSKSQHSCPLEASFVSHVGLNGWKGGGSSKGEHDSGKRLKVAVGCRLGEDRREVRIVLSSVVAIDVAFVEINSQLGSIERTIKNN